MISVDPHEYLSFKPLASSKETAALVWVDQSSIEAPNDGCSVFHYSRTDQSFFAFAFSLVLATAFPTKCLSNKIILLILIQATYLEQNQMEYYRVMVFTSLSILGCYGYIIYYTLSSPCLPYLVLCGGLKSIKSVCAGPLVREQSVNLYLCLLLTNND